MIPPLAPPATLLVYVPSHQVLICTHSRCRHAVAPDSIIRHLKEIHRLKRLARKPYLEYVSNLKNSNKLATQEEVIASTSKEYPGFPHPLLPLLEGLLCEWCGPQELHGSHGIGAQRCSTSSSEDLSIVGQSTYSPCGYLCVSEKRMKLHWRSNHGMMDGVWRKVRLQTWFKGNMLRYFSDGKSIEELNTKVIGDRGCSDIPDSDAALLQHFTTSTYKTLATDAATSQLWRVAVPLLAKGHPFLMHSLLSIAALHRSHERYHHHLVISATQHQSQALPLFAEAISAPTKDNCDAIFIFSHLLTIYSLVSASHDERLLLVADVDAESAVVPQWLHFLRIGCSTLCDVWDYIDEGPVGALSQAWEVHFIPERKYKASIAAYFLSMIPVPNTSCAWTQEETEVYKRAAKELSWAFTFSKARSVDFNPWDALRAWPMRVDLTFLNMLGSWHPGALVLLAHYCILLKQVEGRWYFAGRADSLLKMIMSRLDVQWMDCIRWPMEAIGGKTDLCPHPEGPLKPVTQNVAADV